METECENSSIVGLSTFSEAKKNFFLRRPSPEFQSFFGRRTHQLGSVCGGTARGFAELGGRGLVVTIPTSKTDWALSILWCGRLKNKLQN